MTEPTIRDNTGNEPIKISSSDGGDGAPNSPQADAPANVPQIPPMPEGGQEKYYNAETGSYDYASERVELQYNIERLKEHNSKISGKNAPAPTPDANAEVPAGQPTATEAANFFEAAGVDTNQALMELLNFGNFADATKQALIGAGLPEQIIDHYAKVSLRAHQAHEREVIEEVGGKENWERYLKHLKGMPQAEQEAIARDLDGDGWRNAIRNLQLAMGDNAPRVPSNRQPRVGDSLSSVSGSVDPNLSKLSNAELGAVGRANANNPLVQQQLDEEWMRRVRSN